MTLVVKPARTGFVVTGRLLRGDEELPLADVVALSPAGFVFTRGRVARLDSGHNWLTSFLTSESFPVPKRDIDEFVGTLLQTNNAPRLRLPDELAFTTERMQPTIALHLESRSSRWADPTSLTGNLAFVYGGQLVVDNDQRANVVVPAERRIFVRDVAFENAARATLQAVGFRQARSYDADPNEWLISRSASVPAMSVLIDKSWRVTAEGLTFVRAERMELSVSSGIDWFELQGGAQFGKTRVALPALLLALQGGSRTVALGNGKMGVLPEAWLKKYSLLAQFGEATLDHVRFAKSQVALLDALLAGDAETRWDEAAQKARAEFAGFSGIAAAKAPKAFVGSLRPYQEEGLGWLNFLERFGFGGCLADDMGLGKTIQVLALLAGRARGVPSLIVVPRSLIFNWQAEAAKFAPLLRVLDHSAAARTTDHAQFANYDIVLTTYGVLRRDILTLKDYPFDYVILDEAQAIKTPRASPRKRHACSKAQIAWR